MANSKPRVRDILAATLAIGLTSCGYHPPSVITSEEVIQLNQSHVALRVRSLPDEDIPLLQSRKDLQMLFFSDGHAMVEARITDHGLYNLSRLRLQNLWLLDLGYCNKITDEGLAYLSRIPSLTSLSLIACPRVSDHGLKNLKGMQNLSRLDLRGCTGITDQGLINLAEIQNLHEIQLAGCPRVSAEGVAMLQKSLPKANVVKDETEWRLHQ